MTQGRLIALSLGLGLGFATPSEALPIFQLRITAPGYTSGIIDGTVNPSGLDGSYSASGLAITGSGGSAFSIGSLTASFSMTPTVGFSLSGTAITHLANTGGSIKIALTLANLPDPAAAVLFEDQFSGTFATAKSGNKATLKTFLGGTPFQTNTPLIDFGPLTPADSGADCSAPAALSYSCDLSETVSSFPLRHGMYSITQIVTLQFAKGTLNLSEDFTNSLTDPPAIPEPGTLGMVLSGLAAAFAFGRRKSRAAGRAS